MRNLKALNLVPGRQLDLQDFTGFEATGHQDNIHKLTMARMNSGDAALVLSREEEPGFSIEGQILGSTVPGLCLPSYARNDLELMPGYLSDLGEEIGDVSMETMKQKCYYEDSFFEDGAQWEASHEQCKMCR